MSHLGAFLQNHIANTPISQRELAERMGVGSSHLSRILAGQRKWLDVATVAKMSAGISDQVQIRAELIKAYLLDQSPSQSEGLISIEINPPKNDLRQLKETPPSPGVDPVSELAHCLRSAQMDARLIQTLKELALTASQCPELRKLLEQLTKLEIGGKKPSIKKKNRP